MVRFLHTDVFKEISFFPFLIRKFQNIYVLHKKCIDILSWLSSLLLEKADNQWILQECKQNFDQNSAQIVCRIFGTANVYNFFVRKPDEVQFLLPNSTNYNFIFKISKYRLFFLRSIAQFCTWIYTNCFVNSQVWTNWVNSGQLLNIMSSCGWYEKILQRSHNY